MERSDLNDYEAKKAFMKPLPKWLEAIWNMTTITIVVPIALASIVVTILILTR